MQYALLDFGLLIALYGAGMVHRSTADLRARQHVIVRPSKGVAGPACLAVPGWTD